MFTSFLQSGPHATLHPCGSEIISNSFVIVIQMPTLWNQRKCDASYASWTDGTADFMQCMWNSMGKGRHYVLMTTYVWYLFTFICVGLACLINFAHSCCGLQGLQFLCLFIDSNRIESPIVFLSTRIVLCSLLSKKNYVHVKTLLFFYLMGQYGTEELFCSPQFFWSLNCVF